MCSPQPLHLRRNAFSAPQLCSTLGRGRGRECLRTWLLEFSKGDEGFLGGCISRANCGVLRVSLRHLPSPRYQAPNARERLVLIRSGPDGTLKLWGTAIPSCLTDPLALHPPCPPPARETQPTPLVSEYQHAAPKSGLGTPRPDLRIPPSPSRGLSPSRFRLPVAHSRVC